VLGIFILTSAFAALIWYGTGDNPIDSATMAEVQLFYSNYVQCVLLCLIPAK
jgi:hypothetical protein